MRLVMTLMARNEIDVLPLTLDAHLALGVDHIVAVDNGSTDGSGELLRAYVERGVLTLVDRDATAFDQATTVTAMARHAATELGADWVINVDADEVWWPVAGTIPDVLEAVPAEYGVVLVPRNDFRPAPTGPDPCWRRMVVRDTASVAYTGGRLVPKVAHRGRADVNIAFGNHDAGAPELHWAPPLPLLEVLHYPVRSYAQLERKVTALAVRRTGEGRRADAMRDAELLYERLQAGTLRAWYDELTGDAAAGLADGTLMRDERVAAFAAEGFARRLPEPAVTVALRDAFATFAAWQAAGDAAAVAALAVVEAERDAYAERVVELEALRDHLDKNLVAERVEHRRTAEALAQLRRSRALRAAAAARRALGR